MGLLAPLVNLRQPILRQNPENPSTTLSQAADWLYEALGTERAETGVRVTDDMALKFGAVFGCVRFLAETISSLPLHVFRRANGRREPDDAHAASRLLTRQPNPELSSMAFREIQVAHCALWGNALAEIEFNRAGRPIAFWPIHPSRVTIERKNGRRIFRVRLDSGEYVVLESDEVLFLKGFGWSDLAGVSILRYAREAIALGLSAQTFGAKLFANGSRPSGVLTLPGKLSGDAREKLRQQWNTLYSGSAANQLRTPVLEEGLEFKPFTIPPEDAQFLETRTFQVVDICRWFRVPPHFVAELSKATFSNIEHQSIEGVTYTLTPWLVRIEQMFDGAFFAEDPSRYVKHSVQGLLRGDSAQRASFYNSLFNIGAFSINEIREKEDMNPVENGDTHFVPLNMAPLGAPRAEPVKKSEVVRRMLADTVRKLLMRDSTKAARAARAGADGITAFLDDLASEEQRKVAVRHFDAAAHVLEPVGIAPASQDLADRFLKLERERWAHVFLVESPNALGSTIEQWPDLQTPAFVTDLLPHALMMGDPDASSA